MSYIKVVIIALLSLTLLGACGEQEAPDTLEGKKALLKEKRSKLLALNKEISELEAEITKADPTAATADKVVPVTTETLSYQTFEHYVEVQGEVATNNSVMVSPQANGRITQLLVDEGDRVKKGQLLARIDDAVIRRNIEEVKTQLELATIMFEKQKNLWDKEIGTEVQYLSAKNQKETLERRLETLQEQQDLTQVRAPISGTVEDRLTNAGESVGAGQPIFMLVNNRDLSLVAQLSEAYAPYVRRGDQVEVSFPVLDRNFPARIERVGQTIDPVNRTFAVEVDLPRSADFKPNMYGQIAINDRSVEKAITVPQGIVQKSDDGEFVYVVEEQEGKWYARRRVIELGLSYDNRVEVKQGLQPGDRLVLAGYKSLSDGQQVQLSEEKTAGL